MTRTVRIALLLCDEPLPVVKERYGTCALESHPTLEDVHIVVDGFDIVNGAELPIEEVVKGYDAVMLTGSRYTAHELSPEFVPRTIDFLCRIAHNSSLSHVKIIGICFGHQLISLALGGTCERGSKGWEVGVYSCDVTADGQSIFLWDGAQKEKLFIEQMHRDHVPKPPPGFHVCLTTDKYPVQAMVKYGKESRPHIFSIQGHPEFSSEIVEAMVKYRISAGVWDEATGAEALRRSWGEGKAGGEGLGRVGWAVWNVILA